MADGSITMADGLGIKAIDSHEVRKMQRNEVRDTPLSAISLQYTPKPNFVQSNVYPQRSKPRLELGTSDLSTSLLRTSLSIC